MRPTHFTSYALLGSGRVARHFQFYLRTLGLPCRTWSRNGAAEFNSSSAADADTRLHETLRGSSHVLLAVSDRALGELAEKVGDEGRTRVHFSGAARIDGAVAAHPLMTFSDQLEEPRWYRNIPFVIDEGAVMEEILPGIPNAHAALAPEKRALYHALVSLAGNSSFLLWRNIGDEMEKRMGLPREMLSPFLHQVVENFAKANPGGFTGPVARGDWRTVAGHLSALVQSPLKEPYHDFLALAHRSGVSVPQEIL